MYPKWLSKETGKDYRLPTEAQWEKAARGEDGRKYPWGNKWDASRLNSYEGGRNDTSPVGQYSPKGDSPYGVADMAGNVLEWCADWYDKAEYKRRAVGGVVDPEGPPKGTALVLRGGSFNYYDYGVRCAARRLLPLRPVVRADLLDHEREEEREVPSLDALGGFQRRHFKSEVCFHPGSEAKTVGMCGDARIRRGTLSGNVIKPHCQQQEGPLPASLRCSPMRDGPHLLASGRAHSYPSLSAR